ncbi:MAG: hypothetical protein MJK04_33200 [Psychrosphaera sp.]|nr:hypothetical protein [Psychrosphaera sp.]
MFIKTKVNAKLSVNPSIVPTSQRLLSLGIYQSRQWAVDKHNIVFYRIVMKIQRKLFCWSLWIVGKALKSCCENWFCCRDNEQKTAQL